jgi:hypothetical protein
MNITTVERKDHYAVVTAKGVRNDFESVLEGSKKIREAVKTYTIKYVLADYRKLSFNVPMADALNLVRAYEYEMPEFANMIMAVVTNRKDLEQGEFWESICNKRGYKYRVFLDFDKAENWIQSQIK